MIVDIHNGFISKIYINIKNNIVNFVDIIKSKAKLLKHKDNIISFDENFKFYLLKNNYDYVLALKIIINSLIEKILYSMAGVFISHVTDRIENNLVIRNSGETDTIIDNNKVVFLKHNIKLKAVDIPKISVPFIENCNIGVIDT